MFDKLTQPDDMFAQTDKSAPQPTAPTATAQAAPSAVSSEQIPPILEGRMAELGAQKSAGGGGKVAVIILAILVVIGAAFFISWRILSSRTPVTPEAPETESEETLKEEAIVPESQPESQPEPEPESSAALEVDTDNDGLTDDREAQYNTDTTSPDTDNDGLFDREEIEVYFTDPLDADTDGDTFLDGNEVKAGYNPKGEGKLLEIPSGS